MNQLNYFPKRISIKKYREIVGVNAWSLQSNVSYEDAELRLSIEKDKFRLSYATFNKYEGGVTGYLPFREEDLLGDPDLFFGDLDGGFVGDDIDELIEKMGQWLVENKFM